MKLDVFAVSLAFILLISFVNGANQTFSSRSTRGRGGKLLPLFQVITFPNDICSGSSNRNGTCYTAEECTSKDGAQAGSCASGYGVCCVFSLSCGGMASENCTYLAESSVTTVSPNPCNYKICKCDPNVCRIRLDFTSFVIAGPQVGTAGGAGTMEGFAIGDCLTDSFSVTSPGNNGSPIICGPNTGSHVIVDASDACNTVSFRLGASTSITRSWNIKVTQYNCGAEMAGPDGCLQYYTAVSGSINSFNFPTSDAVLGADTTHLSSQDYNICIRRAAGNCAICYIAAISIADAAAVITMSSFGLSAHLSGAGSASTESRCNTDYIQIPHAIDLVAPLVIGPQAGALTDAGRICGGALSSVDGSLATAQVSVCTQNLPFQVGVHFDDDEFLAGAILGDQVDFPGGTIGFDLDYRQISC